MPSSDDRILSPQYELTYTQPARCASCKCDLIWRAGSSAGRNSTNCHLLLKPERPDSQTVLSAIAPSLVMMTCTDAMCHSGTFSPKNKASRMRDQLCSRTHNCGLASGIAHTHACLRTTFKLVRNSGAPQSGRARRPSGQACCSLFDCVQLAGHAVVGMQLTTSARQFSTAHCMPMRLA